MKIKITILLVIFSSFFSEKIKSEQRTNKQKMDSLYYLIEKGPHDTVIVKSYIELSELVSYSSLDSMLLFCEKAIDIIDINLKQSNLDRKERDVFRGVKADAINNKGYFFGIRDKPIKALEYYHESLEIEEELQRSGSIALSFNNIGGIHMKIGNIDKSLEYFEKALDMFRQIENKEGIATCLNNMSVIYSNKGNNLKALENIHKSLKIREEMGNKHAIARTYNNMAKIYNNNKDTAKALQYYLKGLEIEEQLGEEIGLEDKLSIAVLLNNIGTIYEDYGDTTAAIDSYRRSLAIRKEIGDKRGVAISLSSISDIYEKAGNYDKAIELLNESLKIDEHMEANGAIPYVLMRLGKIKLKQGKLREAKKDALQSFNLSKKLGFPETIQDAALLLTEIFKEENNFEKQLEYFKIYTQLKDSINNLKTQKEVIRQEHKYELTQKETEIEVKNTRIKILEQEKKIEELKKYITGGVFIFSICLAALLYFQYHKKEKIKKEKLEKEVSDKTNKLIDSAMQLVHRNTFLESLKEEIESVKKKDKENLKIDHLLTMINRRINMERSRSDFYIYEKKNQQFFDKINSQFQNLTESEKRLIAFIKMKLSSEEITALLNISPKAVETGRYRLKKKLQLDKETNLNDFIANI